MGNENEEQTIPAPVEPVKTAKTRTTKSDTRVITRGRLVDYNHVEGDDINPLSALVTNVARVGNILTVNMTVFDAFGSTFGVQGVKQGDGPGEWNWPEIA